MDLDTVADELYGLQPEEFVAARDRRALDARKAGDQALAKEIGALRRPSLAAWAGNLLVRRQPEEVQPLLDLGESLRRAHRELDGPQLRKLVRRQSEVIGALGRQARRLAAEAGRPVGEGVQREVEETLHAVLADPEAAREWAAGRLVKPLSAMFGFPEADATVLGLRPVAPAATRAKKHAQREAPGGRGAERKRTEAEEPKRGEPERKRTEAEEPKRGEPERKRAKAEESKRGEPERKRAEAEQRADELAHRRRLNEARGAARDAERDLRAREAEAEAAGREAEEARDRLAEAERRVRELRARLRPAAARCRTTRWRPRTWRPSA
ncbi:hypothetical protein, partial [Streptomyces puniciscabiei]|uniref:hypothetical protein n=1 Tax=Streptomyces puniciscabiei TaxID=164348 RepID=UPI003322A214